MAVAGRPQMTAVAERAPTPALDRWIQDRKFLVVGLGSAGKRHAANLTALGAKSVQTVSARLPQNLAAALDQKPDAVVISTPTSLHARDAALALERGCHVYLEKPAGISADEAAPLAALAAKNGRVVAVGNQLRFNPCLQALKDLIARGALGRLLDVHVDMGEYLPDYHPEEDYTASYAARKELGGGVLLTQIHDLNYLSWIFGPFETAYAVGGRVSELKIDVEDSVSVLLRARSGLAASLHLDFLQRRPRRTLLAAGQDAVAAWDYHANALTVTGRDGKAADALPPAPLDRNRMFLDAMADFLHCVKAGSKPRTGLPEALEDLRAVDAIRASLSADAAVKIKR